MQPVVQDISIYKGDSFDFFFRVRNRVFDPATQTYVPGTYVDLTSWTGKSQIRATEDTPTVIAEFTVTIANQATAPGGVLLSLSPAITSGLPPTGGKWDVQLTNPTAEVRTFIRGSVLVTKEVTRV